MPAIDAADLAEEMLAAASAVLKKRWPDVRDYATQEMRKLAADAVYIEAQVAEKRMTPEQAKLLLGIQRNAARTVLLAAEGIGLLAAEEAINAAMRVAGKAVNSALGFALL
jgi:sulfite reductase beta subunit-like hemoprotein